MKSMLNNKLEIALSNDNISKVLNRILDKLDAQSSENRKNKISETINEKTFPLLYEPLEINDDIELENSIKVLISENIFELVQNKKSEFLPFVEKKAKLVFNEDFENLLRTFYKREKNSDTWIENLEEIFPKDSELYNLLKNNPFKIEGKSNKEIIEKLDIWIKSENKSKSQRHESAKCFWGLSKMFDKRDEFNQHFALEAMSINLLIHSKSKIFKNVLFIENLETFNSAIDSSNTIFDDYVLIFASGFKASAKRIRTKNGSKMFFTDDCKFSIENKKEFISWFYEEKKVDINVYFWGDLDFSGIEILSSLKSNFTNLRAFEKAYSKMLKLIDFGHIPDMAKKENQRIPKNTGCEYTDEVLIPLLKEKKLFLDQEIVTI